MSACTPRGGEVRIDHGGVATDDAVGAGALLGALGLVRGEHGTVVAYGVNCEFWQCTPGADEVAVELVAPARPDSAVDGHLARQGPGLYHIAFEVDDIEAELARLRGRGCVAVDREPCKGARAGMRVAFMYLPRPAAFLIELVQYDCR